MSDLHASNPSTWARPEVVGSGNLNLPSFPTAALPPVLADMVEATSAAGQVPTDLTGPLALAAVAGAAGAASIRLRDDHSEGLNLFVATMSEKGTRKSWAMGKLVHEPLAACQALVDDARSRFPRVEDECIVPRAFLLDDETPRTLPDQLSLGWGRAFVASAEASLFDTVHRSGGANLDPLLKGYSNESTRRNRVGKATCVVPRPFLTLAIAPQPYVVERAVANDVVFNRGLADRFLFTRCPSLVGFRNDSATPLPDSAARPYAGLLENLYIMSTRIPHRERVLEVDVEARDLRLDYIAGLERQRGRFGRLGGRMQGWSSKLDGVVARLAGILHLAEFPFDDEFVSMVAMERAARFVDYFIAHAESVFEPALTDLDVDLCDRILVWARNQRIREFSKRQCARAQSATADALTPALELLHSHGWIRPVPRPAGSIGRPSERWEVHPELSRFLATATSRRTRAARRRSA